VQQQQQQQPSANTATGIGGVDGGGGHQLVTDSDGGGGHGDADGDGVASTSGGHDDGHRDAAQQILADLAAGNGLSQWQLEALQSAAAEGHIDPAALEQIIELARSHLPPGSEESTMADAEQGSWMDGHNGGNNHEQLE